MNSLGSLHGAVLGSDLNVKARNFIPRGPSPTQHLTGGGIAVNSSSGFGGSVITTGAQVGRFEHSALNEGKGSFSDGSSSEGSAPSSPQRGFESFGLGHHDAPLLSAAALFQNSSLTLPPQSLGASLSSSIPRDGRKAEENRKHSLFYYGNIFLDWK